MTRYGRVKHLTSRMIYTKLISGIYAHGNRQIRYVSGDRDLCPRFGRGRDVETKSSKRYSRSECARYAAATLTSRSVPRRDAPR